MIYSKNVLGIFGFFAARTCHKQLSAVRTATESSPEESIDDSENDGSRNGVRAMVSYQETMLKFR